MYFEVKNTFKKDILYHNSKHALSNLVAHPFTWN